MYKRIVINTVTVLFFTLALSGRTAAQDRALISGLEADSVYLSLVVQEQQFKVKEDSLNAKVAETRNLFRTDPDNRETYSNDIIRLESEIFDIRNQIGIVAGKINTIEQEFIIRNLTGGTGPDPGVDRESDRPEKSAVLVFNPLFEDNLTEEDYRMLVEAQRREMRVLESIATFENNYRAIQKIGQENLTVDTPAKADSLYRLYETLSGLNGKINEVIDEDFGFVYDNKLFSYNYILDKLGRRAQLATFEKKITETREQALAGSQGAQSPAIAAYPYRKALLAEYEQALAGIAGYDRSLDSLRKASAVISGANFDFPAVTVEEKLFLDYAEIEFYNPPKYNTRNPVPDLTIHPKGEIYRILLGTFQKAQPVSILKGAYPVGVRNEDGKFSYYAGGFETAASAAEAIETLKSKGFRDPKAARWTNGRLTVFSQGELDRLLGKSTDGVFRISVNTGGKPLPDTIREIIEDISPNAEISRSGDMFIIGTFDSRDEAEEIAEEIEDTVDEVEVKIENVS